MGKDYYVSVLRQKYTQMSKKDAGDLYDKYPAFVKRIVSNYNRVLAAAKAGKKGNISRKSYDDPKIGYVHIPDKGYVELRRLQRYRRNARSVSATQVKEVLANHPVLKGMKVEVGKKRLYCLNLDGVAIFCKWWLGKGGGRGASASGCKKAAFNEFELHSVGVVKDTSCCLRKYKGRNNYRKVYHYNCALVLRNGKLSVVTFDPMNGRPIKVRPGNAIYKGETGTITF